ncbi:MAG: YqgE/AlgH family protein [Flavobacteriales bacterium]|nr:YqgE/AlgH family protein [Flavobacteriales bacterium]
MSIKSSQISQGSVLLSSPWIDDDTFAHTAIYLTRHDMSSSVGLILNRPTNSYLHHYVKGVPEGIPLYNGGPVSKDQLYFLHDASYLIPFSTHICGNIYWGGDFNQVKRILNMGMIDSSRIRFFLGYSGWDAHQMDREIQENSWLCYEGDFNPIATPPPNLYSQLLCGQDITDDIWDTAYLYPHIKKQ